MPGGMPASSVNSRARRSDRRSAVQVVASPASTVVALVAWPRSQSDHSFAAITPTVAGTSSTSGARAPRALRRHHPRVIACSIRSAAARHPTRRRSSRRSIGHHDEGVEPRVGVEPERAGRHPRARCHRRARTRGCPIAGCRPRANPAGATPVARSRCTCGRRPRASQDSGAFRTPRRPPRRRGRRRPSCPRPLHSPALTASARRTSWTVIAMLRPFAALADVDGHRERVSRTRPPEA